MYQATTALEVTVRVPAPELKYVKMEYSHLAKSEMTTTETTMMDVVTHVLLNKVGTAQTLLERLAPAQRYAVTAMLLVQNFEMMETLQILQIVTQIAQTM